MADNIFHDIVRHVQATLNAEQAIGHQAIAARLRAEGGSVYEDESPTGLTHSRSVRPHELDRLMRKAKGDGRRQAGASLETVEDRLRCLYAAVQALTQRGQDRGGERAGARLLEHFAAVQAAWQAVLSLADAAGDGPRGDAPVSAKGSKPRMTRKQANEKAMELAKKMGKPFFVLSENEQARRIGCTWSTWSKTELYAQGRKKKDQLARQAQRQKGAGSPSTVSFTTDLEAVTGTGGRDEVLKQLLAEHKADNEPSPLDDTGPRKVHSRKRL
jgi:hypothetical protein